MIGVPECDAAHAERTRLWSLGLDAGTAGEPMPEGAIEMAYLAGCARRRARGGEVIGFVCHSSGCSQCGSKNWGWRLGCACEERQLSAFTGGSMVYGAQVEAGSDPEDPSATFMSLARIHELVAGGREVLDIMSGAPVPVVCGEGDGLGQKAEGKAT